MSDPAPYDLLLRADRVICPATGLDGPGAVACRAGRIVAAGKHVTGKAKREMQLPGGWLLPGLVDLHAHPSRAGSRYGVDPDRTMLLRGTTTVLSQGDAGSDNWDEYRKQTIDACRTRVRLALNLGARGESPGAGALSVQSDIDAATAARTCERGGELIWGIALNLSTNSCGANDPRWLLEIGLRAADRCGKPLLFGARKGSDDFPLAEQLGRLRAGDVVTYCFRAENGLLESASGRQHVRDCVWEARQRGVLFDLGHGRQSFDFGVAEACLAEGFVPDTISTDFYIGHVADDPGHDLPRTISKLLAIGMDESDAFARVTTTPARILGLGIEAGTLAPGACADLVVMRPGAASTTFTDATGARRHGVCLEPLLTVRAGMEVERQHAVDVSG